jgi:leucyl aminopeptidase (aminopeptidase T)
MIDQASLQRYLNLLVEQGCNPQPGQPALIQCEPSALPLVPLGAEFATLTATSTCPNWIGFTFWKRPLNA